MVILFAVNYWATELAKKIHLSQKATVFGCKVQYNRNELCTKKANIFAMLDCTVYPDILRLSPLTF